MTGTPQRFAPRKRTATPAPPPREAPREAFVTVEKRERSAPDCAFAGDTYERIPGLCFHGLRRGTCGACKPEAWDEEIER